MYFGWNAPNVSENPLDKFTEKALAAGGVPFAMAAGVSVVSVGIVTLAHGLLPSAWTNWFCYPTYFLFLLSLAKLASFLFPWSHSAKDALENDSATTDILA